MRFSQKASYVIFAILTLILPTLANATDSDGDGIDDTSDNCILVPNADQRDSDDDGFGNMCDADLNNDNNVNSLDLGLFKKRYLTTDADADLNGDGKVNSLDLGRFKQLYLKNPGPTGVALPDYQLKTIDALAAQLADQILKGSNDTSGALATALKAAGFSVLDANNALLSVPTPDVDQGLAFTDWEVEGMVKAAQDSVQVSLEELAQLVISSLPQPALDSSALQQTIVSDIRIHANSTHPGLRFWARFIVALGRRAYQPYDLMGTINLSQVQFNTIQAQLILRRLSGDFYAHARRGSQNNMLSLASPVSQRIEPLASSLNAVDTPCAKLTRTEDIILNWAALGISEGFNRLLEFVEEQAAHQGKILDWKLGGRLEAANIVLAYAELVISLNAFKADISLVGGEPLVRTKTLDPGELRTLQAKVYFDLPNGGLANCLRPALNSVGLDFSLPANGPVPNTSVEWKGFEGFRPGGTVEFRGDPVHATTDDQGISNIGVEGTPQKYPLPKWLQQDYVRPVEKEAAVTVEARMTPADLLTDSPDVIGGTLSPLTIPKEMLQRIKVFVASYPFKVKDWESNVFSGEGTYEMHFQGLSFGLDEKINLTFLVAFGFNEEGMVLGGEGNADVTFSGYSRNDSYETCSVTGSGSVALRLDGYRSALSELGWKALMASTVSVPVQEHCVDIYNEVYDDSVPWPLGFTLFDNAIIKDGAVLKFHEIYTPDNSHIVTYTGETRISRQPLE